MATNDAPKLKPTRRTGISSIGGNWLADFCVEYRWKVRQRNKNEIPKMASATLMMAAKAPPRKQI